MSESSPSGGVEGASKRKMKLDWKQILKMAIAILTAIAGTLGVMSCVG
jgi:hypothetical protein